METDDLHSEVSKLQLLIQEEDNKMQKYKVKKILFLKMCILRKVIFPSNCFGKLFVPKL